jgi:hypothetical protein
VFSPEDGDHEGIVCHARTLPNRHQLGDFPSLEVSNAVLTT